MFAEYMLVDIISFPERVVISVTGEQFTAIVHEKSVQREVIALAERRVELNASDGALSRTRYAHAALTRCYSRVPICSLHKNICTVACRIAPRRCADRSFS